MGLTSISNSFSSVLSNNTKVLALEKTLHQSLHDFKDLLLDFEQLHIETDNYKAQFIKQKERCDSNTCTSSEALKRIIETKDNIIQLVASTLTRLNETKDLKILDEAFKILFGETPKPLYQETIKDKDVKKMSSPLKIKKELDSDEEISFREESMSEIEGTPTGRTSPIIQTKKQKSSLFNSVDVRDKKKCPETWPTPEKKALKLSYSTPLRGKQNGRLRQARLNLVKVKETNIIDINSSPEFDGGCRSSRKEDNLGNVQLLVKKESLDNDDTILPSPTSGPTSFNLFKSKESPIKFKKPQLSLKVKLENNKTPKKNNQEKSPPQIKQEECSENILITDVKINDSVSFTQEDSINLLHPKRLPKNLVKQSPMKQEHYDETYCDTQSSISLLHHVDKLENIHKDAKQCSPTKRPLAENINVTNVQDDEDNQPSMSLLQRESKVNKTAVDNAKRKNPELAEIIYKEPTVRKKAEKRMLQGWACEKCIEFFGELYKDNPELLAKKIDECSHHRGVHNPTDRPKTPPNYWNPRWQVPDNTDEFNRMNNVN